jgi:hypothetical protein
VESILCLETLKNPMVGPIVTPHSAQAMSLAILTRVFLTNSFSRAKYISPGRDRHMAPRSFDPIIESKSTLE